MNKKIIISLNIFLVAVTGIVYFLLLHQKDVTINISSGKQPTELMELIQRYLPDLPEKKLAVIAVFNQLPTKPKIEELEKLHNRFNEKVNIVAFFNKPFKVQQKISFPFAFPRNLRLSLETEKGVTLPGRFFVILRENKVEYLDFDSNIMEKAFLLQERLNPERGYNDYAVPIKQLKNKITETLKKGDVKLLHLNGEGDEIAVDLTGISKVYFIHAHCSSCQLKSILKSIKLKEILDSNKSVVIFSVLANSFELAPLLEENPVRIPLYLDTKDVFGLFSIITDDRENPIEIENGSKPATTFKEALP